MKKYTAVFIGGEFDMTKMQVKDTNPVFQFASKPKMDYKVIKKTKLKDCPQIKILIYRLSGTTPNGVLVYEFYEEIS